MENKTTEELQKEICIMKRNAERDALITKAVLEEKTRADKSYAPIIVKTIVFTAIGLICVAFITIFTNAVIKWVNSIL